MRRDARRQYYHVKQLQKFYKVNLTRKRLIRWLQNDKRLRGEIGHLETRAFQDGDFDTEKQYIYAKYIDDRAAT